MGLTKPARGWRITDDRWDDIYRGIEGLWLMNEGTGTIVADSSGHGRHGTAIGGPVWQAGATGWQLSLDGTNDYISVPVPASVWVNDYTIAARVYPTQTDNLARGIVQVSNAGNTNFGRIWMQYNGATGFLRFIEYNTTPFAHSVGPDVAASMMSIAMTRAGVTITGYHNAAASAPATFGGTQQVAGTTVRIGAVHDGTNLVRYGKGPVSYVAIWSRALSAQEVRRLHEQPPWMVG